MVDENLPGIDPEVVKKEQSTFAGHRDYKGEVKEVIEELEAEGFLRFTKEDVFKKSDYKKIPREEAEAAFDELLTDHYVHDVPMSDGIFSRTFYEDYSPAQETMPDW